MFIRRNLWIAFWLICILIVGSALVLTVVSSQHPVTKQDLARDLIIAPGDLNGNGPWTIDNGLLPPEWAMVNASSHQAGLFWYHDVPIHELLIVWNSSKSADDNYQEWKDWDDNLTRSGNQQSTESITAGDQGFISRSSNNSWEVILVRGNVTVSFEIQDNAMGLLAGHNERILYEISTTVANVQDLKILDYQSKSSVGQSV
jgi:hypothetical protein